MAKIAEADIQETISDFFWDDADGPFENILRWAERLGIVFGGGPISIALVGLMAAGIDLASLGRIIDKKYDLSDLSDITKVDPEKAEEELSGVLMNEVQKSVGFGVSGGLVPLSKIAQEPGEDTLVRRKRQAREQKDLKERGLEERRLSREERQKARELAEEKERVRQRERTEDIERQERRRQEDISREEERGGQRRQQRLEDEERREKQERTQEKKQQKRERQLERKERQRERRIDRRERAAAKRQARSMVGSGKLNKAVLGAGIGGIIGMSFKWLTDPKSWLSRALRTAGVIGAEEFAEGREERQRTTGRPPLREPTTNLKTRLESKINEILQV